MKYEVMMDYVCTATIVVDAADEEAAERAAWEYVHTKEGFDRYIGVAAPRNVLFGKNMDNGDGFDIPQEAEEFCGVLVDGYIEVGTRKPKGVRIAGTAQAWDLYDERFDIARIDFMAPKDWCDELTDDELSEIEDECVDLCDEDTVTGRLLCRAVDEGVVSIANWGREDPCNVVGYLIYEEEA